MLPSAHRLLVFAFAIGGCVIALQNTNSQLLETERGLIALAVYMDATMLLKSVFLPFQQLGVFALVSDRVS